MTFSLSLPSLLNKDPDYKRTSTLGKPSVISLQTPNCQHQPIRRDSVYYIGRTIASNRWNTLKQSKNIDRLVQIYAASKHVFPAFTFDSSAILDEQWKQRLRYTEGEELSLL